jgi:hypothetical protein
MLVSRDMDKNTYIKLVGRPNKLRLLPGHLGHEYVDSFHPYLELDKHFRHSELHVISHDSTI